MPQTYDSLSKKMDELAVKHGDMSADFFAQRVLSEMNLVIKDGYISCPSNTVNLSAWTYGDMIDAITYLIQEWDYAGGLTGHELVVFD